MPGAPVSVFTIPRCFSPTHSVAGRLIARRSGDRLRAEALYIFAVTMAIVAWLLGGFAAWAVLAERITADPSGPAGLSFFGIQIAVPIIGILIAGIGFRPEIRIELNGPRLIVTCGADLYELPLDAPFTLRTMDGVTYHRGLRLLDTTRPFINRPVDPVLTITTGDETAVFGLAPEDRQALVSLLSGFTSARLISENARADAPPASMRPEAPGSAPERDRVVSSMSDLPESGSS